MDRPDDRDRHRGRRSVHRRCGEHRLALRRADRGLPATAVAAQWGGREGDPVSHGPVVAHRPGHIACRGAGDVDRWSVDVADRRARPDGTTVVGIGVTEPLRSLPAPAYPAVIAVERTALRSALVSFNEHRYSVPPAQGGRTVTMLTRAGGVDGEDRLGGWRDRRDAPPRSRERRADCPGQRARRAGESGSRGVHDRPCVPAQGEPAAQPARAHRARETHRARGATGEGGQPPRRLPGARATSPRPPWQEPGDERDWHGLPAVRAPAHRRPDSRRGPARISA